jgi:glycyl-tRNA synthetase beta chain
MATYLLEIGLEEMPAHLVSSAQDQLADRVAKFLEENRLSYGSIDKYSTPRRLAVIVRDLAAESEAMDEEVKGPSAKIAKDSEGNWSKAIQGFARGKGLTPDDLVLKGDYYYGNLHTPGEKAAEVLTKIGDDVVAKMSFTTYMKWANYDFQFIRPIQWLVSLLDDDIVPFTILDEVANKITWGHRFLFDQPIVLNHADDYENALRDAFVIASQADRKAEIVKQIDALAAEHSWKMDLEAGLLEEVTNLVEWPTAFIGDFDAKYLEVPEEVLVTSMREHQRYFEVRDMAGSLQPHFVTVRNGNADHIDNVKKGNEKVLVARLEDAEFFWNEDQKLNIDDLVARLAKVTFHEKIGTITEHMARVKFIAEKVRDHAELPMAMNAKIDRAADIYKFDLLTGMVGEFDELQGIMGEKYALLAGEDAEVATAIREHYMPTSADGDLPQTDLGAVLAIADKLDTILAFFTVGLKPSGSNDPYALRRATQGILRILEDRNWDINLTQLINELLMVRLDGFKYDERDDIMTFIAGRAEKMLDGVASKDVIRAVLASGSLDMKRLTDNAKAIEGRKSSDDFKPAVENLSRVLNLGDKYDGDITIDERMFENDSERALFEASQKVAKNDVDALFGLSTVIADFFDNTMVMVEDFPLIKANRLSLLKDLSAKILSVADFRLINVK